MVVKIWKNTQNTDKYSGNQEENYWEKYSQNSGKYSKLGKILKKIQENTNKYLKNGPHLILVKKSAKGWKNTPQKMVPIEQMKIYIISM